MEIIQKLVLRIGNFIQGDKSMATKTNNKKKTRVPSQKEQNNNLTNAVSAASASQAVQAANAKLLIEANTRRSFWSIFRKKKQPEFEQVREE